MQEQLKPAARTFNLSIVEPKDETKGRQWALNREIVVIADDVDAAIAISRREFPNGRIDKVQRSQSIHFFK